VKNRVVVVFAWGLSILVSLLALAAWSSRYNLEFGRLNTLLLFPVFGLLAFSLMWAHYIVGALRRLAGMEKEPLKAYFAVTGWLALAFILLHPSLLIFQLWRNGGGLPPLSYIHYVGSAMEWAVLLGTFSFLVFLSFETKRWFKDRGWWPVIEYAQVVAMFAIIAHSLALGSNLQRGWYRGVWMAYAISLVLSVAYVYYLELRQAGHKGELRKKLIGITIVAILVAGLGLFAYDKLQQKNSSSGAINHGPIYQETDPEETIPQSTLYSVEEVKMHNKKEDCWTIINERVYNISLYISRHPGGDEILRACGEDATSMFMNRHDVKGNAIGSGMPHSSSAQSQLESLQIGTVQH